LPESGHRRGENLYFSGNTLFIAYPESELAGLTIGPAANTCRVRVVAMKAYFPAVAAARHAFVGAVESPTRSNRALAKERNHDAASFSPAILELPAV
jgi:hypothetical protein